MVNPLSLTGKLAQPPPPPHVYREPAQVLPSGDRGGADLQVHHMGGREGVAQRLDISIAAA